MHLAIVVPLVVTSCTVFEHMECIPDEFEQIMEVIQSDYLSILEEGQPVAVPLDNIVLRCFNVSSSSCSLVTVMIRNFDIK